MTEQMLPFDAVTFSPEMAREARDDGQSRAILKNFGERQKLLELARSYAHSYARIHGRVTSDDVRRYMVELFSDQIDEYAKIAGHVFKPKTIWECVGTEPSTVVSRHCNMNRVWRLRKEK